MVQQGYIIEQIIFGVIFVTYFFLWALMVVRNYQMRKAHKSVAVTKTRAHIVMFLDSMVNVTRSVDPKGVLGYYSGSVWTLLAELSTSAYVCILFLLVTSTSRAYYEITVRRDPPRFYVYLYSFLTFTAFIIGPIQSGIGNDRAFFYFYVMAGLFATGLLAINVEFQRLKHEANIALEHTQSHTNNHEFESALRRLNRLQLFATILLVAVLVFFALLTMSNGGNNHLDPNHYDFNFTPFLIIECLAHPVIMWYFWLPPVTTAGGSGNKGVVSDSSLARRKGNKDKNSHGSSANAHKDVPASQPLTHDHVLHVDIVETSANLKDDFNVQPVWTPTASTARTEESEHATQSTDNPGGGRAGVELVTATDIATVNTAPDSP